MIVFTTSSRSTAKPKACGTPFVLKGKSRRFNHRASS